MNRSVCASALVAAVLIGGCGGGGGSDGPTYNAAAAWQALVAPAGVRTIGASGRGSDNVNYVLAQRFTGAGLRTYPRTPTTATRTDVLTTVSYGTTIETADSEIFYIGAGQIIGFRYLDVTATCADVVTTLPPNSARVGDFGPLYTSTEYSNCTPGNTTVVERTTATWSITSISGAPYFCYRDQAREQPSNADAGSEEICIQVAQDGSLGVPVRITLTVPPDFSLVATGGP